MLHDDGDVSTPGDPEVLDDTLIDLIIGDNGASAEAHRRVADQMAVLNGMGMLDAWSPASKIDLFGGPEAMPRRGVGWADAMDMPIRWTKAGRVTLGVTRNGPSADWPNGIKAKGEIRASSTM